MKTIRRMAADALFVGGWLAVSLSSAAAAAVVAQTLAV